MERSAIRGKGDRLVYRGGKRDTPSNPGLRFAPSGATEPTTICSVKKLPRIKMASRAKQTESPISASDKAAALALTPVSRETEARLDRYVGLLLEWQAKTNLVAPSTLPTLWTRHIADSLQLLALAPAAKVWVDLGSGGGFPGVVLACALAETSGAMLHLVERNAKKAAFLREALRVTSTPGMGHLADIRGTVDRITGRVDCVTARAVAPLNQLIGLVEPLVGKGARALFLKG